MGNATKTLKMLLLGEDRTAGKALKGVGKEADGLGSKLGKFASHGALLFGGVATGAALGGAALFKMGEAAAEDEVSQKRLAQQLKNTTGAHQKQIAATEDWITAQGKAYGVADDDLRPALVKLATATESVTKSRKLASLAENVSAGTGKSLATVSAALAKGYMGSTGALGKLGVATKDAHGKALSFGQIQSELAKKFKGQAATAANTFQGKVNRLKLALSEAGESIGYKLLPLAERLAVWFVNKGLPAIDSFVSFVSAKFGPVLSDIGAILNGKIMPAINQFVGQMKSGEGVGGQVAATFQRVSTVLGQVFTWIGNNLSTVGTFVGVIGTAVAISKVWTAAQIALNIAMSANPLGLLAIGIAALAAGFVYAYKHSEKFRAVIQGVVGFIKGHWQLLLGIITGPIGLAVLVVTKHWSQIKAGAGAVVGWVKGHWRLLLGILTGPFGLAVGIISSHWSAIVSGARSVISRVTGFFKGLPGKIRGALGDAGGMLKGIGGQIVDGLVNGIRGAAGKVVGAARELASHLPKWVRKVLDIHSPSRVFHKIGENVVDGLIGGLKSKRMKLKDAVAKMTDLVTSARDKLAGDKQTRDDFASGFSSFSSSIFGRDVGTDANGNALPESVAGILAFQKDQEAKAKALAANVKKLVGLGLSKDLIMQMQSAGSSGIAQIAALASGATRQDIAALNASNKATYAYDNQAGMAAGNAIYGSQIARDAAEVRHRQEVLKELRELNRWGNAVEFKVKGNDLVAVIRKEQHTKGKKATV